MAYSGKLHIALILQVIYMMNEYQELAEKVRTAKEKLQKEMIPGLMDEFERIMKMKHLGHDIGNQEEVLRAEIEQYRKL